MLKSHRFDLFIGSVHHVHAIPIDFDHEMYAEARRRSGGTDAKLFEDYFDLQFEMLQALKPPVVGHFDLIRLKSDDPNADCLQWEAVRNKVTRNLEFIVGYGGLLELSSAALRKGLSEPYPAKSICEVCWFGATVWSIADLTKAVPGPTRPIHDFGRLPQRQASGSKLQPTFTICRKRRH